MLLNIRTIKLASITQNNHVYKHTAEDPTPKVLLNIRSPYRRQKRDLSIIRLSFRRPLYTGIEIPAINITTFLPTTLTTSYLPTFLRSHRLLPNFLPFYLLAIDYFLLSYLLATTSTTSYLPTFLRSHRPLPTFLPFCDHIDYFLTSYLPTFLRSYRLPNNPYSLSQSKPRWIYHAQAW
jgi:hypothetical protein